ncbi:MAG: TlpA family protein disulfide reductase [Acidimicrobiales bacterium]
MAFLGGDCDAGLVVAEAPRPRRPSLAVGLAAAVATALLAGLLAYVLTPPPSVTATARSGTGAATAGSEPGAGLPELGPGKVAPGFSLPRLGGGRNITLSAYRGRPVILNFFASWCPGCRAELRTIGEVSVAAAGKVSFIGIDTNDSDQAATMSLLRAAGDRYPVGVDASVSVATGEYLVLALPSTVFLSSSGRVVGQVFGGLTYRSLTAWVRRLESLAPGGASKAG